MNKWDFETISLRRIGQHSMTKLPTMSEADLERLLHEQIPVTWQMGITVDAYTEEGLVLRAPLAPNINDKGTAFAGSLSALVTLAGWGLIRLVLSDRERGVRIAAVSGHIQYDRPVTNELVATCRMPDASALARLKQELETTNKGRIELTSRIEEGGVTAVSYTGEYAVQMPTPYSDPL